MNDHEFDQSPDVDEDFDQSAEFDDADGDRGPGSGDDDALADCGRGFDYEGCTKAGSEDCDECPFWGRP